jgi:pyruvate dehydrogenase (quinone)
MIEAYVDPFEPTMPPNGELEFVKGLAKSSAKRQPCAKRIGLTLFRDQLHDVLKNIDSHSAERQKSGHVLE